jgi:2-keto-3-deoxy-L-rhamnonate aldolase RhmA
MACANGSTVVIGLIEDDLGLKALPANCSSGFLDAILFGPTDLAVSLGMMPGAAEVQAILDEAADTCHAAGVPHLRLADSLADITNASRHGASTIVYSVDIRLLKSSLLEARAALDAIAAGTN